MRTDAAGYAVLRFLSTWRSAWLESVGWRGNNTTFIRLRDVHCHWDGSYGVTGFYRSVGGGGSHGGPPPPNLIHRSSRRSMCPDWYPANESSPTDERLLIDLALAPAVRDRTRTLRAQLLDSLAIFDRQHPGDAWITGQRVRFMIDQGEPGAALDVARVCTAGKAWCSQLAGFALHAAGDFARADSAFDAASAAMTPERRCEWTNAALLLDDDSRGAYEHLNCDERVAANERLWWVTRPFLSDSVDDRRSEDFARKVLVELHGALPWDERYDFRNYHGGQAVSEMILRYGWPAYSAFTGQAEEADHAGWMNFYDSTRTATAEYPQDRLHLVPQWRAVNDPFHAPADAWQLNMPPLSADDEPAAQWWPAEHYGRAGGNIIQLSDQTVMLRRDNDVLLATASELGGSARALHDHSAAGMLVRSTGPHQVEKVPHQTYVNATSIVLTGNIPIKAALVGTELPSSQAGGVSARTRFGVVPPAPLASFGHGETAISDPVLLGGSDAVPTSPEDAIKQMLGSTYVRSAKLGIYWETYGFTPSDSTDVAVVITRHEKVSKLRRLGMLLHVAGDINGSVAVRWKEPQSGHTAWSIPGVVPILARSIQLDMSQIEPGHYIVQVLVGRRGGAPLASSREFVLAQP